MGHRRRICTKRQKSWVQKAGLYGACILCLWLVVWQKGRVVQRAEIKQTEVCTRVQTFVDMMEVGIPVPPNATTEEERMTDMANERVRVLLSAALGDVCGG